MNVVERGLILGPLKLTVVALFLAWFSAGTLAVQTLSDYRLGSGDKIKITVYDEQDLSMEIRLSDAGTISYPFLGEIQVAGLTVGQLESKISQGLQGDYLVHPEVSVAIEEYRQFYIHGEVKQPGGFPYVPGITLRKAIALAGGFTERASHSKIYVIHDNARATGEGDPIKLDDEINPGDTITVEQSFF